MRNTMNSILSCGHPFNDDERDIIETMMAEYAMIAKLDSSVAKEAECICKIKAFENEVIRDYWLDMLNDYEPHLVYEALDSPIFS